MRSKDGSYKRGWDGADWINSGIEQELILVNMVMNLRVADLNLGCDASSLGEWGLTFKIS
jgi:hypothetical protein